MTPTDELDRYELELAYGGEPDPVNRGCLGLIVGTVLGMLLWVAAYLALGYGLGLWRAAVS